MKYLSKPILLCTVCLLASCYEEAIVGEESTSLMITLQMPNNQKGNTRVDLNPIENSKDLYATWSPNDKVQAILRRGNEMYDLGRVKVTNISEDQRTATINYDGRATPNLIPPYTIFLFTGNDHPASADMIGGGNWAAYCTYDLQRGVGGYFHAPLYCRLEVKSDGKVPTAQFQHIGTYELLHVYNATNLPITFAHQGFQTEQPWYQATSTIWFYDGYDTSPHGEWDGDTESQTMTIMPGSENIVYSWYIPSGYPVSGASLIACINGKYGVLSSNTFSSSIMPQQGHAYHMYATWDGKELKFDKGDELVDELGFGFTHLDMYEGGGYGFCTGREKYYTFESTDPSVATAEANDDIGDLHVEITAHSVGSAIITVTDIETGKKSQIEVVVAERTVYAALLRPGETEEVVMKNKDGVYEAYCEDTSIATCEVVENRILVTGIKSGQTIIHVTEKNEGKQFTIEVVVYTDGSNPDDVIEGSCGENVTYTFNEATGTLTISGKGAMSNYSYSSEVPWYSYRKSIKKAIITNGVTSIGDRVFVACTDLTSVTIPISVTYIGDYAFYGCSGLTFVTIPNSVTSIGYEAFADCSSLTSVTIGNSVTSIGAYAFEGCRGLTSVTIPNSVICIGERVFWHCFNITSITIGNSVTSIGYEAFSGCSGLTSITIPNSVTSIGKSAFYDCSGLISVTIGNSVTSIGDNVFRGCSGLTSITIPNSVTSIGTYAFFGCHGLTSVTIGNNVTSIGDNAFYGCSGLTSITIPNSVTKIRYGAFKNCSGLTSVTIPNSVTSIGADAFGGCIGLNSISVEGGNTIYDSRENCKAIIETSTNTLIAGCKNSIIPNSVTSVGNYAFSGCSGLTSITIPNSVTSVGNYAFSGCSGLTSITIPNSVTSIGDYAFGNCSGLFSATIGNNVTSIGKRAFAYCSGLASVTIGNNVTFIGEKAFEDCSSLTFVTIPNSVTSIGGHAFAYCSGLTSVTIGNNVTYIDDYAFFGCTGIVDLYCLITDLSKLTLSSSSLLITTIGNVTLHVPKGCKDMYAAVEPWRNFKEIVEISE